jgi:hypothetical protein
MANQWDELTKLTGDKEFYVTRVRMKDSGICIEGEFEQLPLAQLSYDDQVFVAQFIRCHGSIKEMEQAFGVSYPTIKARLNRINEQLAMVEIQTASSADDVIGRLERGEISTQEAVEMLKQK